MVFYYRRYFLGILNLFIAIGNGIRQKVQPFLHHQKVRPYSSVCSSLFGLYKYLSFSSRFFILIATNGLIALFLIGTSLNLHSVMISSVRIAYVDIERVFDQLQKVEDFRSELRQIVQEKKKEIEEIEKGIASVRHKILNQKDELPIFELEEFENLLTKKEKELRGLMEESKLLIKGKEKEYKYKILGEIYDTINKVADVGGYTVVFEKNLVLFSEESAYDITDEVISKINTADE